MSLPLKLNFSDYDKFLTDPNYTTSAEAQDYFRNMDMIVEALVDIGLWQPETNYPNGYVVFSPNMPNGTEAVCVAETGGRSSNTEPEWGSVGGDNISDGTCFWKLRWKHWSKENATNRLPNTTYAVGDVMLHKSNLSVALKCTTAGTTSSDELDISGVSVGDSVEDGSVVWKVITRSNVLDENGTVAITNGGTNATTIEKARVNLGLSTAITGASISGKVITLTFADGTTKTLTTQDSNTSNWTISKSDNGYARDETTGFTIQWGYYGTMGQETTATITFPVAFSTKCLYVDVNTSSSNPSNRGIITGQPVSKTQGKLINGNAGIADVRWVAYGY